MCVNHCVVLSHFPCPCSWRYEVSRIFHPRNRRLIRNNQCKEDDVMSRLHLLQKYGTVCRRLLYGFVAVNGRFLGVSGRVFHSLPYIIYVLLSTARRITHTVRPFNGKHSPTSLFSTALRLKLGRSAEPGSACPYFTLCKLCTTPRPIMFLNIAVEKSSGLAAATPGGADTNCGVTGQAVLARARGDGCQRYTATTGAFVFVPCATLHAPARSGSHWRSVFH